MKRMCQKEEEGPTKKKKKKKRSAVPCEGLRVLFGLESNGPVNTMKVMLSRSVYLTTLFLGRLNPPIG